MAQFKLDESDLEFTAIRASGPGGQNVNKVSTAVQLRFDIQRSSLPARVKARLLAGSDRRINKQGIVVLKAQRYRSQEKNKQDAIQRLSAMIEQADAVPAKRIATKPGRGAKEKRLRDKKFASNRKNTRSAVSFDD